MQPQHESSDFSVQPVRPASCDVSELSRAEMETDSLKETDRFVLLVGDLERKLAQVNSSYAQVIARLMSDLDAMPRRTK